MKTMQQYEEEAEFEQEVEKAMNETGPTPPETDTDKATKNMQRMFSDAASGFNDRRIELENEIATRQAELADIKIAIESINVALKSIEAGVSLKQSPAQKQGVNPTPTSGISMAKANAQSNRVSPQ